MKVCILKNEESDSHVPWVKACEKYNVAYDVVELTKNTWLQEATKESYTFYLLKPPGEVERFKSLYDERIYILNKIMGLPVYPSYEELVIHENKKTLSYFLKARKIPHPRTDVFYYEEEAAEHIAKTTMPVVAKTSIGSSGSGVEIIRSAESALAYIKKAFNGKGIRRRLGPNRVTGSPKKWLTKAMSDPAYFFKKLKYYKAVFRDTQQGYVILQEFIPHDYEWRAAKIGNSYFAHQKIKFGDKASGSKGINYVTPPEKLLNFVKELCDSNNFDCMSIDLFEDGKGGYVVNELQTVFGHVQKFILEVDGKIGRYVYENDTWKFEEGEFNTNESYDLRLQAALTKFAS
ncbi:MAG: hypothetical protein LWX56_10760 [Ignavibacteria bacterium]|nr:hypothetical protein [Ignavibacteria bacterium]